MIGWWNCQHVWKDEGSPFQVYTSNSTGGDPPENGYLLRQRKCLICGETETILFHEEITGSKVA